IGVTDIVGTYHAEVPAGRATLVLNADRTWNYRVEGKIHLSRAGKWTHEAKESTRSTIAIICDEFDFGFPLEKSDRRQPGYKFFYFEKAYSGKFQTCIQNLGRQWGPKGRLCFERE